MRRAKKRSPCSTLPQSSLPPSGRVYGPGSSVSSQQALSSSSTWPPSLASLRSARTRSSRTFMPRMRPVSPEGQVMVSDTCCLRGRQSLEDIESGTGGGGGSTGRSSFRRRTE